MLWVREWWREFGEAIRTISPHMAGAVHDHFQDGAMFAFHFIDKDELKKQRERNGLLSMSICNPSRTHGIRLQAQIKHKPPLRWVNA